MQAIRPTWQLQPQRALDAHALQTPRPRPLRARPSRWGDSEPLLVADLGHLELAADVAYGSQQRRDLELQVSRALLTHFGPHLAAVVQRRRGPAPGMLVRHGPRSGSSATRSCGGSARPPSCSPQQRRRGSAGAVISWPPSLPAHLHPSTRAAIRVLHRGSHPDPSGLCRLPQGHLHGARRVLRRPCRGACCWQPPSRQWQCLPCLYPDAR